MALRINDIAPNFTADSTFGGGMKTSGGTRNAIRPSAKAH